MIGNLDCLSRSVNWAMTGIGHRHTGLSFVEGFGAKGVDVGPHYCLSGMTQYLHGDVSVVLRSRSRGRWGRGGLGVGVKVGIDRGSATLELSWVKTPVPFRDGDETQYLTSDPGFRRTLMAVLR